MLHYVNKIHVQGIALITVLLFLQMVTLLGFYVLQAAFIAAETSRSEWQQHVLFMTAEERLTSIEAQLATRRFLCNIPITSKEDLKKRSISEWRSKEACGGEEGPNEYHYVVESLGEDDCAEVQNVHTEGLAPQYLRLTLLLIKRSLEIKVLLQSTFILLDNASTLCQGQRHTVSLGRQTWIELR